MSKVQISKFLSADGLIRASAVSCASVLNELQTIQGTLPPSTLAISRALISNLLMSSHLKDGQVLSIQLKCDGPLKMLFTQASHEGQCRAYISEPKLDVSVTGAGKLALAPLVGQGTLTVSHYVPGRKLPQTSQVMIESGEITEDIANYILTSQQLPCLLTTGLNFNSDGSVLTAGGLLVELMPGHTEKEIRRVEGSFAALGALSEILQNNPSAEQILRMFFLGYEGKFWDHPFPIHLSCTCSKDKVLHSMKLLGEEDLKAIIEKEEETAVDCQMCGRGYVVDVADVKLVLEELRGLH